MKKIKRLARPKTGRKTYSHSVSLTLKQIEWLRQFPNASEKIRKLIDSIMELHGEIEPQLSPLALIHEIDILEKQKEKVREKRIQLDMPGSKTEPEFYKAKVKAYDEAYVVLEAKIKELRERLN